MAKVKIEGNASGTGTFTIAAPNSNLDRTLTLPDEAGTVLTSAGAGTDYLTPTGDGSNLTGITSFPEYFNVSGSASTDGVFEVNSSSQININYGNTGSSNSNRPMIILGETDAANNRDGEPTSLSQWSGIHVNSWGVSSNDDYCYTGNSVYGQYCRFTFRGTTTGSITGWTSSVSYNTSSDYRLKENVIEVVDPISKLKNLHPVTFNFIADPDTSVDGFLAHEAQDVAPYAVTGSKDAVKENGDPIYQQIDHSKLVPLLTAALQEAVAKIEALETRIAALEA